MVASSIDRVRLGRAHNPTRIVWVTDYDNEAVRDLISEMRRVPRRLIERLGITGMEKEDRCLVVVYRRSEMVESIHVPRALDGIDNPQFGPTVNCHSPHGITRPLDGNNEDGLPEAVHRHTTVKVTQFEVGELS